MLRRMAEESRSSQTAKATLGVRELVLEGVLTPGERVPEIGLADRLGRKKMLLLGLGIVLIAVLLTALGRAD